MTTSRSGRAKAVPLNELPFVHPGSVVLHRCFTRRTERRDRQAVTAEYDDDKYARALQFVESAATPVDARDVRLFEFGWDRAADWCFSEGEDLFRAPLAEVQARFEALVVGRLETAARGCRSVVELGCGYGYNLHRLCRALPDRAYLGGDIAPTAARLARRLFGEDGVRVVEFDYHADDYALLREVEGPVLVFTCHSVEQLPKAGHMVESLARHAGHVTRVLHFEPVYESHGETLIGLLRRAYADSVDYNRDLLGVLEAHPRVHIEAIDASPFGINPLNPTTVIEWTLR